MEKQRWEESEKRREEERRSEKRKSQKKEDAGAGKGRKVVIHCVFPMICGSGGSKSRLAKAAGAEPSGQMREHKLHAIVARSIFRSQHVQNTPTSDHFWKWRCRKSARRCGPKHISKWKVLKTDGFRALLEVEMLKMRTALWREARSEVSSPHFWTFRCRFAWQAQGILHLVKSEEKRQRFVACPKWQPWDIRRGSAKMHFPWQAQYKRHVHQSC